MTNTNLISGTAMGVIVGTILIIAPWTIDTGGFFAKLFVSVIGVILVFGAMWLSKG